jgi:proteasome lid subunit RPN8/RPN11
LAVTELKLTAAQADQIRREGAAVYPNECCGVMIGKDDGNQRFVRQLKPLTNSFDTAERYHRFSLSPKDLMRAEKEAAEAGELVLGFYHSHPDHPARPSEYDRQHAWPFYSYVIVAIETGKPAAMTSWRLQETTEQFEEEKIEEVKS